MLTPVVLRRLTRELQKLQRSPPDGIAVDVGEQDILDVDGWIQGPAETPYANGFFRVHFTFQGTDFPAGPPKCVMQTKIFHPNIHANGEICVSTLKKDWSAAYGIEHILMVIKCLLISPNPDSALDAEAARLLQEAYEDYASTAAIWTRVHASHRPACMPVREMEESAQMASSSSPAFPSSSSSKKVEADAAHVSIASAQPLTRSSSRNVDLQLQHQPPPQLQSKRTLQITTQDRRLSSTTANNLLLSSVTQSLQRTKLDENEDQNGQLSTNITGTLNTASLAIGELGAAATAAAATAAAMTAAVTIEMTKCTLNDRSSNHSQPLLLALPLSPSDNQVAQAKTELMPGSSLTWPTRRRAPIVRRGIKRL